MNYRMKNDTLILILVYGSILLALISLSMPAFRFSPDEPLITFSGGHDPYPGILVLILGWVAILEGVVAWYGNPVWLFALYLFFRKEFHASIAFSSISICLGLSSFLVKEINEREIHTMGCGFYVWLTALVLLLLAAIVGHSAIKPNKSLKSGMPQSGAP